VSAGKVVLDPDQLLTHLDSIQEHLNHLRQLCSEGFTTRPIPTDIDITAIKWMKKGKQPAGPGDKWAWAFAYDRNGHILPETRQLVEAINRYGKVEVDGFEITLGGRDGKLLNRRKIE